jgi:cellulose synthase (UDP-forming)
MADPPPTWLSVGWASMITLILGRMILESVTGGRIRTGTAAGAGTSTGTGAGPDAAAPRQTTAGSTADDARVAVAA